MLYALPTDRSPVSSFRKVLSAMVGLCLLALTNVGAVPSAIIQSDEGLRFELPANGNLRIENLLGGVIAEVWKENYVSVVAITDSGRQSRSPAVIQRTDSLLSIRVARGTAGAQRINLQLRIPERAHTAIITSDGSVEVLGTPAALLIQTVSGEIRAELTKNVDADVVADSKTGAVSSSLSSVQVSQASRPQLQARLGKGGRAVKLFSQAGNITLATTGDESPRIAATTQATQPERREPLEPGELPSPKQRPELSGQNKNATGAGTAAPPSNGPEEISEGDIIRIDTELVSVNVSVVDRGTNRGVNDLTKDDFRLYEDNVPQQIAHFDSASAPFNLVLLIDLSGSTTKVVDLIKAAALHFVEAARPFDRIGVITFAGGQVVVSSLTTDHEALRQRINAIERPQGSTKLYDSLAFGMDEVFREAKDSRRNAIVVISDGLDSVLPNVTGEGSKLPYEELVRRVKEFDGVVYSIWTDTQSYEPLSPRDIQQETFDLAHDRMKEMADVGGGAFYECEELKDLAGAYDRVVADLGTVYTLSYRPTKKVRDGSWRAIRVDVNRQNSVARGKRGYYAK
ncbi:MAG TPA: VWA domain-containing protein [Pyrinomonadaceae bacterium]